MRARKSADPIDAILRMRKATPLILGIIMASFALALYLYPMMPDSMASHWDAGGAVDGYTNKCVALFIMPLTSVLILLMFLVIPRIDPLKNNIAKFRNYFDAFIVLIAGFLFYLYVLTIQWNLGMRFDMVQFLAPALGVVIYYSGILIEHAERNWFIGIRTPWTMSSDVVWKKTHELGGKLFKVSGAIAVLGLFQLYAIYLVLVPVILSSVIAAVYSYFEYQKQPKKKKKK